VVVVVVEGGLPDRTLATASSGEKVTCKSSDRGKATCSVVMGGIAQSSHLWTKCFGIRKRKNV